MIKTSDYLQYLPPVLWSRESDPNQFLGRMLRIFEKILTVSPTAFRSPMESANTARSSRRSTSCRSCSTHGARQRRFYQSWPPGLGSICPTGASISSAT